MQRIDELEASEPVRPVAAGAVAMDNLRAGAMSALLCAQQGKQKGDSE